MWERSEVSGVEVGPNGHAQEHLIQFYDVGIGGDGLRAPMDGLKNPHQKFLAHHDSPEVWKDNVLTLVWEDKPIAFVIKSKQVAEKYKHYFEYIWKAAKK